MLFRHLLLRRCTDARTGEGRNESLNGPTKEHKDQSAGHCPAVQKIRMEVLNMTIKEIFEHSQNVDGWILGIDGYASKVDLGNPAILAGIGKYRVRRSTGRT